MTAKRSVLGNKKEWVNDLVIPLGRARFVNLVSAYKYNETSAPTYGLNVIIEEESEDELLEVAEGVLEVCRLAFEDPKLTWDEMDIPMFKDGEEKDPEKYPEYQGKMFVALKKYADDNNLEAPAQIPILDIDDNELGPEAIYDGCYVECAATAKIYELKNPMGQGYVRGVQLLLDGVYFVADGERFKSSGKMTQNRMASVFEQRKEAMKAIRAAKAAQRGEDTEEEAKEEAPKKASRRKRSAMDRL